MNTNNKCACSGIGCILLHRRLIELLQSTAWPLLDRGAGVEQLIDCLISQNCQAVKSMGRSMDWTLEDNMVNSLFFSATLTEGHAAFV